MKECIKCQKVLQGPLRRGLCDTCYRFIKRNGNILLYQKHVTESQIEVFWRHVKVGDNTECWLWTYGFSDNGYGKLKWNGKFVGAHRISFMIHHGPILNGLVVRHTCDVKNCVNPNHLVVGTQKDNMIDRLVRGRGRLKVSKETAEAVRSDKNIGKRTSELSNKFQLSPRCIRDIVSGRKWKSANGPTVNCTGNPFKGKPFPDKIFWVNRFLKNVDKDPAHGGCWVWAGRLNESGYGILSIGNYPWKAHRLAYVLHHNTTITPRDLVLHSCDNRKCVNPDHLRTGTQSDNVKDAVSRGRMTTVKSESKPL